MMEIKNEKCRLKNRIGIYITISDNSNKSEVVLEYIKKISERFLGISFIIDFQIFNNMLKLSNDTNLYLIQLDLYTKDALKDSTIKKLCSKIRLKNCFEIKYIQVTQNTLKQESLLDII